MKIITIGKQPTHRVLPWINYLKTDVSGGKESVFVYFIRFHLFKTVYAIEIFMEMYGLNIPPGDKAFIIKFWGWDIVIFKPSK